MRHVVDGGAGWRPAAGRRAPPTIANAPRHGGGRIHNTWAASNWSGYAETGNFTGASGTWTVPTVAPSTSATYSATWVGVDGFTDTSLIQTGTEDDYYSGAAHYGAWWEILPGRGDPAVHLQATGGAGRHHERQDLGDVGGLGPRKAKSTCGTSSSPT